MSDDPGVSLRSSHFSSLFVGSSQCGAQDSEGLPAGGCPGLCSAARPAGKRGGLESRVKGLQDWVGPWQSACGWRALRGPDHPPGQARGPRLL